MNHELRRASSSDEIQLNDILSKNLQRLSAASVPKDVDDKILNAIFNNKKVKSKKLLYTGVAASITFIASVLLFNKSQQGQSYQELENLISETQLIESKLKLLVNDSLDRVAHEEAERLKMELIEIDIKLNQTYLDGASENIKMLHWKERQQKLALLVNIYKAKNNLERI
ncbi:MAG: hypothetical protein HWD86_09005 [Kangiellaceae bacterium]|nr:hypothetical protein [Kangiellaceae bacterium]